MSEFPLFDSLTHPTLDGQWMGSGAGDNTLRGLEEQMAAHDIRWALAVGMKGIGGYSLHAYADHIRTASQKLFPIAYYDYCTADKSADIQRKLTEIARCGYAGIKLHPRFSQIDLRDPALPEVFQEAAARKLLVLVCTYLYGGAARNSYHDFAPLLAGIPKTGRVVLLHGGDVNLLAMMEMTRHLPNVLLDLSFTICRYEGSSVDLDIRYLLRSYDRRICVGSDSPQFSLAQLRRRFDELANGVDREKCLNAAHRNLQAFVEGS